MTIFSSAGLVAGGRIGPQVLGHQGPRLVADYSHIDIVHDPAADLYVCPLNQVFTEPRNPVIVFGNPNVSVILPNESDGWDRFAAFMMWRKESFITDTKGRVQAGVFFELLDAPAKATAKLREALSKLVGTRKASCAHSVALALHQAGFTADQPLTGIFRPSRLAAVLWRGGLRYGNQRIELRVIQTRQAVSDHFVAVWKREANTGPRLAQKYCDNAAHGKAPVFGQNTETIEMSGDAWTNPGLRADLGISIPSRLGVNLGYLFGEQPEFVVELPQPIDDPHLPQDLKAFPGRLDGVTRLKKYVIFSPPIVWLMRKHLSARTDWIKGVPVAALINMLRRSPGPNRDEAFVYNFTLTPTELRLKRLLNNNGRDQKIIAWLLAKHVLQAKHQKLCLAGEVWCYNEGDDVVICLSGNSGTYKPTAARVETAANLLSAMFQARVLIVAR